MVNFHPWSKSNPATRSCRASIFIHGNPLHIYPSFIWTAIILRFGSVSSNVAGEISTGNLESVFSSHRKAHTAAQWGTSDLAQNRRKILQQFCCKSPAKTTEGRRGLQDFFLQLIPVICSGQENREKLEWLVPWQPRCTGYCSGSV